MRKQTRLLVLPGLLLAASCGGGGELESDDVDTADDTAADEVALATEPSVGSTSTASAEQQSTQSSTSGVGTAPPATTAPPTAAPRTTTTTVAPTTTSTQPPVAPWASVPAPEPVSVGFSAGFEDLGTVTTFCVEPVLQDQAEFPKFDPPDELGAEVLTTLGFVVVDAGCEATLTISAAAHRTGAEYVLDPLRQENPRTCWNGSVRSIDVTLSIGGRERGAWTFEREFEPPQVIEIATHCQPDSAEPVTVHTWELVVARAAHQVFGSAGFAACLAPLDLKGMTGPDTGREIFEDVDSVLSDQGTAAFLLSKLYSDDPDQRVEAARSLYRLSELRGAARLGLELGARTEDALGLPPYGLSHTVPHLIAQGQRFDDTAEIAALTLERITGDGDFDAAWSWWERIS